MTPQPKDLLELRLTALAADIDRVQLITEDAKRRHSRIDNLTNLVGDFAGSSLRVRVEEVMKWVGALASRTDQDDELWDVLSRHELVGSLKALPDQLTTIWSQLGEVARELKAIQRGMIKDPFEIQRLTTSLDSRCHELTDEVNELRRRLQQGDDPRDVWIAYEKTLENGCQDLFADYVDFLAGLTLRDNALDDEVCAITDALLAEIPRQVKHLALPARRPTLSTALNKLVKVGFPEWTIWNIPLVGHEIGLALAAEEWGRQLIGAAGALPARSVAVRTVLFADAYAAYTIGPAYGCAMTLLRFQPNHDTAGDDAPSDVERSVVVMAVQRYAGRGSAGFQDVTDRTEQYWTEAVTHLGGLAGPPVEVEELTDFADQICHALGAERIEVFDRTRWATVETLAGTLTQESGKDARAGRDVDARVLLNAAWVARLANPPSDIRWATTLTSRVQAIWRSVDNRRSTAGERHGR